MTIITSIVNVLVIIVMRVIVVIITLILFHLIPHPPIPGSDDTHLSSCSTPLILRYLDPDHHGLLLRTTLLTQRI